MRWRIRTQLLSPVVLLLAQQQDGPTYRVGFNNFHALTRYNHSALYALAVNELAQAIALRLTPSAPGEAPTPTTAKSAGGADLAPHSSQ